MMKLISFVRARRHAVRSCSALAMATWLSACGGFDSATRLEAGASARIITADAQVMTPEQRWSPLATDAGSMCPGAVTDTRNVQVPRLAKPAYLAPYTDPALGGQVQRITNARSGEVFKPVYSSMQAWNADESLLLLYRGGVNPSHVLLDGHDYGFVEQLDILPSDVEEVWWSHNDPRSLFYVSKSPRTFGHFRRYDTATGRSETLREFDEVCGSALPTAGGDVQMQSLDDDLFGFRCRINDDKTLMFTWRRSTDQVAVAEIGEGTVWHPWTAPVPAPSGDRVWLQGYVLDDSLTQVYLRQDLAKPGEHANIGTTHDGYPAFFSTVFDPSPNGCSADGADGVGHLVQHRMDDGSCTPIINEAMGYPYTTSGTHVSARATGRPGVIALSSIGYGSFDVFDADTPAPALFSEIYVADTRPGSQAVCRLAHHRSFGKSAGNGSYNGYFGEPHATISPSGTRVVFGSDWYDSGSVDTYVVELPDYKRARALSGGPAR